VTRRLVPLAALVLLISCPGSTPTTSVVSGATVSPGTCKPEGCNLTVHVGNLTFRVLCDPVAEALTDIDLPHHAGEPRIKAIAGIARVQGVAVFLNEPDGSHGCGLWSLALVDGLSDATANSIRAEVRRGVDRFGVTATPIPKHGT
jgi:hypothetical protein